VQVDFTDFFTKGGAVVADFNGDGLLDVATANTNEIGISLNTGGTTTSTFAAPKHFPVNPNTPGLPLFASDFNGDNKVDLLSGDGVLLGNGDGTFQASSGNTSGFTFNAVGDINGDGKPDVIFQILGGQGSVLVGKLVQTGPPADFSGSISPSTVTAAPNNSATATVTLTALNGFSSDVTLSASGLPTGVTASFASSTITGGNGSTTLTVNVGSNAVGGTYTFTVTGTGGGVTHSTVETVVVNAPIPDFSVSLSPDNFQNVAPGQSAIFTVTVAPQGGFSSNVNVALTGTLPPGATSSISPTTITGANGTSTIRINIPPGATANVYSLTLTLSSGGITKSTSLTVGVNTSGGDFTGTFTTSQTSPSTSTGLVEYVFNIQGVNGYTAPVNIAMSGFPAGAVNDGPITVTPGSAGGIHVNLTNVVPGTYPILVTFTGTGIVHKATVQLVVTP
jgi:hypothetical protein